MGFVFTILKKGNNMNDIRYWDKGKIAEVIDQLKQIKINCPDCQENKESIGCPCNKIKVDWDAVRQAGREAVKNAEFGKTTRVTAECREGESKAPRSMELNHIDIKKEDIENPIMENITAKLNPEKKSVPKKKSRKKKS